MKDIRPRIGQIWQHQTNGALLLLIDYCDPDFGADWWTTFNLGRNYHEKMGIHTNSLDDVWWKLL